MMKRLACGLILLLPLFTRAEEDGEKLFQQMINVMKEMGQALKSSTDEATAKNAVKKLNQLQDQLKELNTKVEKIPPEDRRALAKKHEDQGQELFLAISKEMKRISGSPRLLAILGRTELFQQQRRSRVTVARLTVEALERAVEVYRVDVGEYPPDLESLTKKTEKGKGPYLANERMLKDPWGKKYQYEAKGKRNKGRKPDIWSLGPPGNEKQSIGNWESKKKP